MKNTLLRIYDRVVLDHPFLTLLVASCIIFFFVLQVPKFKLDASDDSLVLENDADLYYHRQISDRYGGNDILVVTYTAKDNLFLPSTLADLKSLRDELRQLQGVSSVTTILDVPLLLTSGVTMTDLADAEKLRTLENAPVEKSIALEEFNDNPLYRGRLVSPDGKTTALLLGLPLDQENRVLLKRRFELREKKYKKDLSAGEAEELEQVSKVYREKSTASMNRDRRLVDEVRTVMDRHRDQADL
jgi:predicted RND superfamily exporter protein